mgnify:CR=1 FL=1
MTKEKELFQKLYPAKEVADMPLLAAEAIGYLKHLKSTNPTQSYWIDETILMLLLSVAGSMVLHKGENEKMKKEFKRKLNAIYGAGIESDKFTTFVKIYPFKEVYNNPFKLAEVLGYLRGLENCNCCEEWIPEVRDITLLAMAFYNFN